jgi:hypothetical protein
MASVWLKSLAPVHPEDPILAESRPLIETHPTPWGVAAAQQHRHDGPCRGRPFFGTVGRQPRLNRADRLLWVWLSRAWSGWQDAPVFVKPRTVISWQRKRFRAHWTRLSRRDPRWRSTGPVHASRRRPLAKPIDRLRCGAAPHSPIRISREAPSGAAGVLGTDRFLRRGVSRWTAPAQGPPRTRSASARSREGPRASVGRSRERRASSPVRPATRPEFGRHRRLCRGPRARWCLRPVSAIRDRATPGVTARNLSPIGCSIPPRGASRTAAEPGGWGAGLRRPIASAAPV